MMHCSIGAFATEAPLTCLQKIRSLFTPVKIHIDTAIARQRQWIRQEIQESIVSNPEVKEFVQKALALAQKNTYFLALRSKARKSTSTSWDRAKLVEIIQQLHQHGVLSIDEIKGLIADPRIKGLSNYLRIDTKAGKLVIEHYEYEQQVTSISNIVSQVHPRNSQKMSTKELEEWTSVYDQWEDFLQKGSFSLEELKVLEEKLTFPIAADQVTLYQSYINFAQTYRATNNSFFTENINRILPRQKNFTSINALKDIRLIAQFNTDWTKPTTFLERIRYRIDHYKDLIRGRATFLDRFRWNLHRVETYHQKTLEKELRDRRVIYGINPKNKNVQTAMRAAFEKRRKFERLYMGCRARRFSEARTNIKWPFITYLTLNGIVMDFVGYVLNAPDSDVPKLRSEYWQQIGESMQEVRWWGTMGYELVASLIFTYTNNYMLNNPFTGAFEKFIKIYLKNSGLSIGESFVYEQFFGTKDAYLQDLLRELIHRDDFDQIQNRIWEIVEDAGLTEEFRSALERATIDLKNKTSSPESTQAYSHRQQEITVNILSHQEVQQVIKEIPARIQELKQNAMGDLAKVMSMNRYTQHTDLDFQSALEQIGNILSDPERKSALMELVEYIETSGIKEKVQAMTGQVQEIISSYSATSQLTNEYPTVDRRDLLEDYAMEVFIEALADASYKAQAGEIIQTGNASADRFAFFRGYGLISGGNSVLIGLRVLQLLCRGNLSTRSYVEVGLTKTIDSLVFSYLGWNYRKCAIGLNESPTLEDVLFPQEKQLCDGVFFLDYTDEIQYLFQ